MLIVIGPVLFQMIVMGLFLESLGIPHEKSTTTRQQNENES